LQLSNDANTQHRSEPLSSEGRDISSAAHVLIPNIGNESELGPTKLSQDLIAGDKIGGDKIAGDKITYQISPVLGLSARQRLNRSRMLDKVETFWIKGLLEQSLYQIARLELGLKGTAHAVAHPWENIVQQARYPGLDTSLTSSITQLFDARDCQLLILGAPGGGKTTLLLELARDLLARARHDEQQPIPVVFNLSTWAMHCPTLQVWLVDELKQRYNLPSKVAEEWVAGGSILPLLDGLDEVAHEQREQCVTAINTFRDSANLAGIVVCCRHEDYQALGEHLHFEGAILIQPLTRSHVETYLAEAGTALAGVRHALDSDLSLWDMLDSPLMLSIVALAYNNGSTKNLHGLATIEERRRALFDDYIAAMFRRRGKEAPYTSEQTIAWLGWLADRLVDHQQTMYYIERMQPSWLAQPWQRRLVTLGLGLCCLCVGLLLGTLLGLRGARVGALANEPSSYLIGGLSGMLLGGVLGWVAGYSREIQPVEVLRWSSQAVIRRWKIVLGVALFSLIQIALYLFVIQTSRISLDYLLTLLPIGLLISCLLCGLVRQDLVTRSVVNEGMRRSLRSALIAGAAGAVLGGLGAGLATVAAGGTSQPSDQLLVALHGALCIGLLAALLQGGRSTIQHVTLRLFLAADGSLLLRLRRFLNYGVERIFLRQVGGGYIFVHRLLMEHFAERARRP
jgi:hypothetical protein